MEYKANGSTSNVDSFNMSCNFILFNLLMERIIKESKINFKSAFGYPNDIHVDS